MRGVNKVIISGNIVRDGVYNKTSRDQDVCSFQIASDRHSRGDVVTAFVRINVFTESLVNICERFVRKGAYVIVEGELMNRPGTHDELTEVRAKDLVFVSDRT